MTVSSAVRREREGGQREGEQDTTKWLGRGVKTFQASREDGKTTSDSPYTAANCLPSSGRAQEAAGQWAGFVVPHSASEICCCH